MTVTFQDGVGLRVFIGSLGRAELGLPYEPLKTLNPTPSRRVTVGGTFFTLSFGITLG